MVQTREEIQKHIDVIWDDITKGSIQFDHINFVMEHGQQKLLNVDEKEFKQDILNLFFIISEKYINEVEVDKFNYGNLLFKKRKPIMIQHNSSFFRERKMNLRKLAHTFMLGIFALKNAAILKNQEFIKKKYNIAHVKNRIGDFYSKSSNKHTKIYMVDFVDFFSNITTSELITSTTEFLLGREVPITIFDTNILQILKIDKFLFMDSNVDKFFSYLILARLRRYIGITDEQVIALEVDSIFFTMPENENFNFYKYERESNEKLAAFGHKINKNKSGIITVKNYHLL